MVEYVENVLKNYEVIGTDKVIVNTESIDTALKLTHRFDLVISEGDLREVDIHVPPMFSDCVMSKESLGIK